MIAVCFIYIFTPVQQEIKELIGHFQPPIKHLILLSSIKNEAGYFDNHLLLVAIQKRILWCDKYYYVIYITM